MNIPILLKINSIDDEIFEVETSGIAVYIRKKYYIVTVHQGLPIKEIECTINNKLHQFRDFVICGWNDLILIPIDFKPVDLFVFKQFVQKQIDISSKYYLSDMGKKYAIKYTANDFMPINMIPSNPTNLYYKMYCGKDIIHDGDCGKPIYTTSNKLVGIISKAIDDSIYVIPTIYIVRTIEKKDNSRIYTINDNRDFIIKFDRYCINQHNNTIYYKKINSLISLDTFITLEGDINTVYHVSTRNIHNKRDMFIPFENTVITNSNYITIDDSTININSCFIHLMKILYKDDQLIKNIFSKMEESARFEYMIKNKKYILYF
jgi:hypothetical protein